MLKSVDEPDWRVFRWLSKVALDRLCTRVLAEIRDLAAGTEDTAHDR
jgi:hypothetical protein